MTNRENIGDVRDVYGGSLCQIIFNRICHNIMTSNQAFSSYGKSTFWININEETKKDIENLARTYQTFCPIEFYDGTPKKFIIDDRFTGRVRFSNIHKDFTFDLKPSQG